LDILPKKGIKNTRKKGKNKSIKDLGLHTTSKHEYRSTNEACSFLTLTVFVY
jgi:hypothetical protein